MNTKIIIGLAVLLLMVIIIAAYNSLSPVQDRTLSTEVQPAVNSDFGDEVYRVDSTEVEEKSVNTNETSMDISLDAELVKDRGDSARRAQKDSKDASDLQNDLDSINNP